MPAAERGKPFGVDVCEFDTVLAITLNALLVVVNWYFLILNTRFCSESCQCGFISDSHTGTHGKGRGRVR